VLFVTAPDQRSGTSHILEYVYRGHGRSQSTQVVVHGNASLLKLVAITSSGITFWYYVIRSAVKTGYTF
jgi:hypothetical protein